MLRKIPPSLHEMVHLVHDFSLKCSSFVFPRAVKTENKQVNSEPVDVQDAEDEPPSSKSVHIGKARGKHGNDDTFRRFLAVSFLLLLLISLVLPFVALILLPNLATALGALASLVPDSLLSVALKGVIRYYFPI